MSDQQPLNDESLSHIEDLLTTVDLRADPSEQTKILLACGRAEGRAELQKTLRRWKAGAAAMSTVSVCLLTALIWRTPAAIPDSLPNVADTAKERIDDSDTIAARPRPRVDSNDTLYAATDWSAWVEKMNSRPERTDVKEEIVLPQKPTLMASSRIDLQKFLNE
jgi:hypothetical protein